MADDTSASNTTDIRGQRAAQTDRSFPCLLSDRVAAPRNETAPPLSGAS
jgi:hypothetical protein